MLKEPPRPRSGSPRSALSAPVLGRLLVMQSVVGSLPDEESIFSFVCRGLLDLPGVAEASYVKSPGETTGASLRRFPIRTGNCNLGELLVNVSDPAAFAPYESYLENFSVMVAVILTERHHRQLNELHQTELEERVQHRTADLARANAALRVEVTERKRAEAALQASEARLRAIIETEPECVKLVASDGRLLEMNPAGLAMIEAARPDQVIGRVIYDLIAPEHRNAFRALTESVCLGQPGMLEFRMVGLKGAHRWLETHAVPFRRQAEGDACLLAVTRDITQRKQAEAEVTRHREHLEELVAARTADLQMANRDLEAFSYSASHDLRAPLRAIDGCAYVLLEDFASSLEPEGQRMLGLISHQTKRMGQLIDDLLTFSRLGRQSMQTANIDMDALAQEVFREQSALSPKHTVEFKISPLPPALGDRAMIRVVLNNLLSNAIKYSRGRTPPLIEMGGTAQAAQNLYFVKDNGVGFDMNYVGKLFGVFQRLHAATEFEGNGVGLALVQRIIHRHGGRVWAEAKPNEGATFYFSLPAQNTET